MAQKILLAVDGSACSIHAANALIAHIKHLREAAHVHPVYVHLPVPLEAATRHTAPEVLTEYYREEGQAQLAPVIELLAAAGVVFTPHIHVGDVADTLISLARDLGCDFICMGTHGHGAVGSAVLGSVSAKVMRRCDTPLMLIPRPR